MTDLIRPEPKPLYKLELLDAGGEAEAFHATDDHPWKVEGKGWVETANLVAGDRIDTASGADMVVTALTLTERIERTYNLTVADWHTFMVGEDRAVVHNACKDLINAAKRLGYKLDKSVGRPHGQDVFKKGNKYISRDADGHRGGAWKMFEMRGGRLVRTGTWDETLTKKLGP